MFYVEQKIPTRLATVVSELNEPTREEELQEDLLKDDQLRLDAPVSLSTTSMGGGGSGIGPALSAVANPSGDRAQSAAVALAIGNRQLSRPLSGRGGDMKLDSIVGGLKGVNESIGAGGDGGAIDRISQEILRQIDKNKVLVAWIFDSSASMEPRRTAIANRFDRVYRELDELGVIRSGALLTTVVSSGREPRFLLDRPTDDVAAIRKAVRQIKDDETGIENLFVAVRETAQKYRRFQTAGGRSLVIILITDEIGDDRALSDETVAILKRNRVPVYVLGPVASFSRPTLHDLYIDPATKFRFWIPIERGPYTRTEEVLRVAFLDRPYLSGFGPFSLTQIARETGGIYFVYGDDRVGGLKAESEALARYRANYGSKAEYDAEINASDLRRTLMEIVEAGNKIWNVAWPYPWIHEERIKQEIETRQRDAARFIEFARGAIPRLQAVEHLYAKEGIPRWRANYDLSFARLLLANVRCEELNWACADLRLHPRTLKDPKKNNGFYIEWIEELKAGGTGAPNDKGVPHPRDSKSPTNKRRADEQAMLDKSFKLYERLKTEHAGTPWAEAAAAEQSKRAGVRWIEGFNVDYVKRDDETARNKVKVPKR